MVTMKAGIVNYDDLATCYARIAPLADVFRFDVGTVPSRAARFWSSISDPVGAKSEEATSQGWPVRIVCAVRLW